MIFLFCNIIFLGAWEWPKKPQRDSWLRCLTHPNVARKNTIKVCWIFFFLTVIVRSRSIPNCGIAHSALTNLETLRNCVLRTMITKLWNCVLRTWKKCCAAHLCLSVFMYLKVSLLATGTNRGGQVRNLFRYAHFRNLRNKKICCGCALLSGGSWLRNCACALRNTAADLTSTMRNIQ